MSVLSAMRPLKIEDDLVYCAEFSFKGIRDLINSPNMHTSRIKLTFDDLLNTQVEIFEKDRYIKANLFSHYELDKKNIAKIILSKEMTKKFITKREEYTIIELNEYVELPNNYSKELYRLLRQFRHTGLLFIKKEDFRGILNPPKSYNEYDFIRKVVNPAIKSNEIYFDKLIMHTKNPNVLPDVVKIQFEPHEKTKILSKLKEGKEIIDLKDSGLLDYVKEFTL